MQMTSETTTCAWREDRSKDHDQDVVMCRASVDPQSCRSRPGCPKHLCEMGCGRRCFDGMSDFSISGNPKLCDQHICRICVQQHQANDCNVAISDRQICFRHTVQARAQPENEDEIWPDFAFGDNKAVILDAQGLLRQLMATRSLLVRGWVYLVDDTFCTIFTSVKDPSGELVKSGMPRVELNIIIGYVGEIYSTEGDNMVAPEQENES